jgi:hypothetical protein
MEFNKNIIPNLPWTYFLLLISLFLGVIIVKILKYNNNILKYIKSLFLSFLFFFILRNTLLLLAFFIGFYINLELGNLLWIWLTNNIFKVIFFEIYLSGYFIDIYCEGSFLHSLFKSKEIRPSNIIIGEDIANLFSHAFTLSIKAWNEQSPKSFENIIDKLTDALDIELDNTQAELLTYFNQSSDYRKNDWQWVCMGYTSNKDAVYVVPYQKADFTMSNSGKVDVYRLLGESKVRKAILELHNVTESQLKNDKDFMLFLSNKRVDQKLEKSYFLYVKIYTQECFTWDDFSKNTTLYIENAAGSGGGHSKYYPGKTTYGGKNLVIKDLTLGKFIKTNLITPLTYTLNPEHKGLDGVQVLSSFEGEILNDLVKKRLVNLPKE